ncbi:ABC transporter substrate-binding protein [Devosia sp. 2618]|uniref:ABC transporter substrate-binding protein n=1 Tax=Devosia sp. 2618 TaxID=3156454 RepID=UPI003398C670
MKTTLHFGRQLFRLAVATALAGLMIGTSLATAQSIPDVPRNRTLISQGWDFHNQVPAPDNFNPYAGVLLHQRNSLHYTVNEALFYTNHNTNELIPWQAEGYTYNDDFTEITIKLRDGVKWSDGEAFDAEDVAFTFGMLKAAAPDLMFSSAIAEWVKSAEIVDPLTVKVTLTKAGPRWAADFLATGQSTRFVVVPKHIWEGQDPMTFGNFDLAKGWPVGTGPFKLVKTDSSSVIYDLRDSWWAADAGVAKALPQVQRVVYVPATQEAMPQLFAGNQIDMGRSIQPGQFEAIRFQNQGLVSWNTDGPVWGAPDGCTFAIRFNTQKAPFDNVALRQAINAAIDRNQVVNLAYEGSVTQAVLPVSSYQGLLDYVDQLSDVPGVAELAAHSPERVAALLEGAGFTKNGDGKWANADGSPLQIELQVAQGDPIGPVLSQQLQNAGFDSLLSVQQGTALTEAMVAGNFQMNVGPHCGSLYDPWQTLEHFHSKYAAAEGESSKNLRAPTRYANPELDAILDRMEQMQPSPANAEYVELVKQATAIFARDLPEISLAEEFHTLVFNATYWTGYPNAENPYVAPYLPWEGFAMVVHNLTPTQP